MRLLRDLQVLTHLHQRGPLTQQPICFPQLANNLLRSVMPTLHAVLLTHTGNRGLTKHLDLTPVFGPGSRMVQRGSGHRHLPLRTNYSNPTESLNSKGT